MRFKLKAEKRICLFFFFGRLCRQRGMNSRREERTEREREREIQCEARDLARRELEYKDSGMQNCNSLQTATLVDKL
jgi:hypothetical protein